MEYGFSHSNIINNAVATDFIVKVTGRLLCSNIEIMCEHCHKLDTVYANIAKDDWGGNISNSQFVIAPLSFWKDYFFPKREKIDDSTRYHFEHLLYDSISNWKKKGKHHREFWVLPEINGVSGTTGQKIKSSSHRDIKGIIMYFLHRLGYRGYLNPFYKGEVNYEIEK